MEYLSLVIGSARSGARGVCNSARPVTMFPGLENNKFHQPGEQRAARVEDLFAIVAPRYDLINDLQSLGLHRRWKRTLVKMAGVHPGDRALDVCCGTGDVAFALRRSGAEVTAVDFSAAMLAVAEQRAKTLPASCSGGLRPPQTGAGQNSSKEEASRGDARTAQRAVPPKEMMRRPQTTPPPIQFLRGDALQLPFPDQSFEIVTVAYGLRNLADWERGLEEMWRVGRPGGRLLVLDFGKPDNAFWRWWYFAYLKLLVPWFGKLFCKDSATHAYIFASLQNYPAQRGVAAKMQSLGCAEVGVRNLLGGAMSINYGLRQAAISSNFQRERINFGSVKK